MIHRLEIEVNAEGGKSATLSPLNGDGEPESGFRIAGPKAWGGSRNIARLQLSDGDIVRYINEYAPHIKELLFEKST